MRSDACGPKQSLALKSDDTAKGGCDKIGLTLESFGTILCEIGTKHGVASEPEIRVFILSLRIDELALARACAAGQVSLMRVKTSAPKLLMTAAISPRPKTLRASATTPPRR